jgi:hypothetical protein
MNIKKTTVLMAAVLAAATVLAAGLIALPGSVQEAQANPCSNNIIKEGGAAPGGGGDGLAITTGDQECDLTGYLEFDE